MRSGGSETLKSLHGLEVKGESRGQAGEVGRSAIKRLGFTLRGELRGEM